MSKFCDPNNFHGDMLFEWMNEWISTLGGFLLECMNQTVASNIRIHGFTNQIGCQYKKFYQARIGMAIEEIIQNKRVVAKLKEITATVFFDIKNSIWLSPDSKETSQNWLTTPILQYVKILLKSSFGMGMEFDTSLIVQLLLYSAKASWETPSLKCKLPIIAFIEFFDSWKGLQNLLEVMKKMMMKMGMQFMTSANHLMHLNPKCQILMATSFVIISSPILSRDPFALLVFSPHIPNCSLHKRGHI